MAENKSGAVGTEEVPGNERPSEERQLAALRAGDEAAFVELVERYGPSMLRTARLLVGSLHLAEEVVQETWLRVLRSVDRFEGRSSLRTWIFVILGNCARRRGELETRSTPLADPDEGASQPSVDGSRFFASDHPRWPRAWATPVADWDALPERRLLSDEAVAKFQQAIATLPDRYATVMTLRDVEDWTADEVCALLEISPENQRVLLHRARARVRNALEEYLAETET